MFNTRKCPHCGGNVPEGNEICNNCGQKVRAFVRVSPNGRSNNKDYNPFETKKSNNVNVVAVFIIIFVFSIIIGTFATIYESFNEFFELEQEVHYGCDLYCDDGYTTFDDKCMCSNGDIYDEDGELEHSSSGIDAIDNAKKCNIYCDELFSIYDGTGCSCSNGKYYDLNGNLSVKEDNLNNIFDEISQSIDSGKKVFIYSTGFNAANLNKTDLESIASKYGNIMFYFIDSESIENIKLLKFNMKYNVPTYIGSYYVTFSDGIFNTSEEKDFTLDEIDNLMNQFNN